MARHRAELLAALARLLDQPGAAEALLLPPSVAEPALAANRRVAAAPTLPAMRRYAGTLYQGLDVAGLSAPAARQARTDLLIFSGLLGVSRGGDPVPDYRVPAKAVLPGLGVAATFWRPRLARPAAGAARPRTGGRPALHRLCRHVAAGAGKLGGRAVDRGPGAVADPAGRLAVVSYRSKLAKGRLAAALLERQAAGRPVNGPEDLLAAWSELGGLTGSARTTGRGTVLELREAALPTPA